MTKSEQNLFREVHKNAQMALEAIHAIEDKVYAVSYTHLRAHET